VDQEDDLVAVISITTNQDGGRTHTSSIKLDQPFYPSSENLTRNMDKMIENILGLNVKPKDDTKQLVRQASLAGANLGLLFPVEDALGSGENSDASDIAEQDVEDILKRHLFKFGTIRFEQLSGSIIKSLRELDLAATNREQCLNTIAAAGILYCQLDHVKQGFHKGEGKLRLLCVSASSMYGYFRVSTEKSRITSSSKSLLNHG
jgi:hypothetical protein